MSEATAQMRALYEARIEIRDEARRLMSEARTGSPDDSYRKSLKAQGLFRAKQIVQKHYDVAYDIYMKELLESVAKAQQERREARET
jgi:hypothetical protein